MKINSAKYIKERRFSHAKTKVKNYEVNKEF